MEAKQEREREEAIAARKKRVTCLLCLFVVCTKPCRPCIQERAWEREEQGLPPESEEEEEEEVEEVEVEVEMEGDYEYEGDDEGNVVWLNKNFLFALIFFQPSQECLATK